MLVKDIAEKESSELGVLVNYKDVMEVIHKIANSVFIVTGHCSRCNYCSSCVVNSNAAKIAEEITKLRLLLVYDKEKQ